MSLANAEAQQVRQLLDDYLSAWNDERDPAACASYFTNDGDLLAADGVFAASPQEIEQYYADRMGGAYANFRLRNVDVFSVRGVATGVALLDAKWEIIEIDDSGEPVSTAATPMGTLVAVRDDDRWRIAGARIMIPWDPGAQANS